MIGLPDALSPWAGPLGLFPPDLSLSLGALVQRLALAIGPLREARTAREGEVDGVSGLARRGDYQRLLLSEWLLLDEAPDEFVRRAASSEHAFLELGRREPGQSRRSLALFDTGPSQLGGPRVAQIAALIVLAARAEAAGVRFSFGLLQDRDLRLFEEVSRASVEALVAGRGHVEVEDDQLTSWEVRVASLDAPKAPMAPQAAAKTLAARRPAAPAPSPASDDVWLVGSPRLATVARRRPDLAWLARASVLTLDDVLEVGARAVELTLRSGHHPGSPARTVRLPLPLAGGPHRPDPSVRLLRDPFGPLPGAPAVHVRTALPMPRHVVRGPGRPVLGAQPMLSADGNRLVVQHERHIAAWHITNSSRTAPGKPLLLDLVATQIFGPETPVAAGYHGKRLLAVTVDGKGAATLVSKSGRTDYHVRGPLQTAEPVVTGKRLRPLLPWNAHGAVAFLDGGGRLFRCSPAGAVTEPETSWSTMVPCPLGRGLLAVGPANGDGAMRVRHDGWLRGDGSTIQRSGHLDGAPGRSRHVLTGFGGSRHHPLFGALAVRIDENRFRLLYRRRGSWPNHTDDSQRDFERAIGATDWVNVRLVDGAFPVGIVVTDRLGPRLVCIAPSRDAILLVGERDLVHKLPWDGAAILSGATATSAPLISWLTQAGEVIAYSLQREAVVLRGVPSEGAA